MTEVKQNDQKAKQETKEVVLPFEGLDPIAFQVSLSGDTLRTTAKNELTKHSYEGKFDTKYFRRIGITKKLPLIFKMLQLVLDQKSSKLKSFVGYRSKDGEEEEEQAGQDEIKELEKDAVLQSLRKKPDGKHILVWVVDFCDELTEELYVFEMKNIPRTDPDRLADMIRDRKTETEKLRGENDELKKKLQAMEEKLQAMEQKFGRDEKKTKADVGAWICTSAITNTFLTWTARINSPDGTYTINGNQIRFNKAGLYRVNAKTTITHNSGNGCGYTDLYFNGTVVSRFYQNDNRNYYLSTAINEILDVANGHYIQVYVHNTSMLTSNYDNSLTIERLG